MVTRPETELQEMDVALLADAWGFACSGVSNYLSATNLVAACLAAASVHCRCRSDATGVRLC